MVLLSTFATSCAAKPVPSDDVTAGVDPVEVTIQALPTGSD
jgi:hypothetical protein